MVQDRVRQFIFPITTGRTGTTFVTHLLQLNLPGNSEIHHERGYYRGSRHYGFGIDTPEVSHFARFNTVGNDDWVRAFWAQKNQRLLASDKPIYAEISHPLVKAGLIENIDALAAAGRVDLVILTRDIEQIMWSFINRMVFTNYGFTWLFALDPRWPNVIVDYAPFEHEALAGMAAWYIHEMWARAAYYRLLLAGQPNVHFHRYDMSELVKPEGAGRLLEGLGHPSESPVMPPRANSNEGELYGQSAREHCRRVLSEIPVDHIALARAYLDSGRRLGDLKPD
jgi:hypothetical protein